MKSWLFGFLLLIIGSSDLDAQRNKEIAPDLKSAIQKIKISGREVTISQKLQSDYGHNNVEIVVASSSNYFKYRLIHLNGGRDNSPDWIYTNKLEISFLDLLPGKYEFQIEDIEVPNIRNPVSIQLEITRPWWRTWWFWSLCFLCTFGFFYNRERILKNQEEEEEDQKRKNVELELKTLQLQMNPHFIFNALNSIQSYVINQDTVTANDYLSKFAHLIRMFLDSSRCKYISIAEEMSLLQLYTEMESLRFEGKFDFEIKADPSVYRFIEIPTMILQPFVENAINHGIIYKKGKGKLRIKFMNRGNFLVCTIEDDGVGRKKSQEIQSKSRKGFISQGLKITEQRLITYNKINQTDIKFSISDAIVNPESDSEDVGTIITIQFPKSME